MSIIGVDKELDQRWDAGSPECATDWCNQCGECLGCFADNICMEAEEPAGDRHEWLNSKGEVKFV